MNFHYPNPHTNYSWRLFHIPIWNFEARDRKKKKESGATVAYSSLYSYFLDTAPLSKVFGWNKGQRCQSDLWVC